MHSSPDMGSSTFLDDGTRVNGESKEDTRQTDGAKMNEDLTL